VTHRLGQSVLAALLVVVLAACTAGAPAVRNEPTPADANLAFRGAATATPAPRGTVASAPATATATSASTATAAATVRPRRTPTPAEPTATPRPAPPPDDGSGLSQVYTVGTSGRPEVALTFDAGADRGYAAEILDTLAAYGVKASFGITGQWAAASKDLIRRMVDEGHMVFNHTWNHYSFTGASTKDWHPGVLTAEERQKELIDTERAIEQLTGYNTRPYYRSTYGDYDDSVLADIAEIGYYVTLEWNCDSLAWNGASVAEIVERCGENATPGDIILMHVGAAGDDWLALPDLIETLQAKELAMVTAEELLQP
jgi:peptidoglycan/xylan/chitin deacetylase (PgdA/CDA1 family)